MTIIKWSSKLTTGREPKLQLKRPKMGLLVQMMVRSVMQDQGDQGTLEALVGLIIRIKGARQMGL